MKTLYIYSIGALLTSTLMAASPIYTLTSQQQGDDYILSCIKNVGSNSITPSNVTIGANGTFTTSSTGGKVTLGTTSTGIQGNQINESIGGASFSSGGTLSFNISLTESNFAAGDTLFQIGEKGASSALALQYTSGGWTFNHNGDYRTKNTNPTLFDLDFSQPLKMEFAFSGTGSSTGSQTYALYVNGNLVSDGGYYYAIGSTEYNIGGYVQSITLGGVNQGTGNSIKNATFSDVKVYNQMIPEPSSATLGILGLGSLLLRRRRTK